MLPHDEVEFGSNFTSLNPLLTNNRFYYDSVTHELKAGDGVNHWNDITCINGVTLLAGKGVNDTIPSNNDFLRFCSSTDEWRHDNLRCFDTENNFKANPTVIPPAYQIWVELDNISTVPT